MGENSRVEYAVEYVDVPLNVKPVDVEVKKVMKLSWSDIIDIKIRMVENFLNEQLLEGNYSLTKVDKQVDINLSSYSHIINALINGEVCTAVFNIFIKNGMEMSIVNDRLEGNEPRRILMTYKVNFSW